MATTNTTSPIRATEILDPYPERPTSAPGARQTGHLEAVPDQLITTASAAPAHTSFTASIPAVATNRRPLTLPIASTTATISGQAALGALMATQTVDPALGLTVFVAWLTCGLAVIFAQCASIATQRSNA